MKEIPLTKGLVALVDDEDFEWLNQYKWYAHHTGKSRELPYAHRNLRPNENGGKKGQVYMHQAILGTIGGDHKDGDSLNNQRSNLRSCEQFQNMWNRSKAKHYKQIACSSRFKGLNRGGNKWRVRIQFKFKRLYIGMFDNEKAAARAYNEKAVELFGEFAKLNEI